MEKETRAIFIGTLFILLFGMISHRAIYSSGSGFGTAETAIGSWACTAEVQICPDGSYVNRTPPYCHFAECKN